MTIGGVNAPVQFAGLVAAGEFQINVMVPSVPSGDQPIVITTAGQSAQSGVMIPIQSTIAAPLRTAGFPPGWCITATTAGPPTTVRLNSLRHLLFGPTCA